MSALIGLIAIAIAADGAAGLVGALLPEAWLRRYRPVLMGFAMGVLLGTTALDLIPAALTQMSAGTLLMVIAASGSAMALVEWGIGRLGRRRSRRVAWMLLSADALHNAADGAAIAAAFSISARLGALTSLAVIAHELPEELADYIVLRGSALDRKQALVAMTLIQLTAGIGAALTLGLAAAWKRVSGMALAIGAGSFVYIALVDLAPVTFDRAGVDRQGTSRGWVGLSIGLSVAALELLL